MLGPVPLLPLPLPLTDVPGPRWGNAGGTGIGSWTSGSVAVPEAVVTCADVALLLPGHQATNQPSATVATTSCPSSSTSVTAVTPGSVRPSTSVYGPSLGRRQVVLQDLLREPGARVADADPDQEAAPVPLPAAGLLADFHRCTLDDDAELPLEETWSTSVKDELVKQAA